MSHAIADHDEPPMESARSPLRLMTASGASAEVETVDEAEVLRVRNPEGAVLFEYDAATGTGSLRMPGNLRLESLAGSIDLVARDGVRCVAGGEVSLRGATAASLTVGGRAGETAGLRVDARRTVLAGDTLVAAAKEAEVHFQKARYLGKVFNATVERAETLYGELTTRADTLVERATNAFRQVEELHQLHAGRLRTLVEGGMRLEGGHVVMRAKEEVHIDGEHINLG